MTESRKSETPAQANIQPGAGEAARQEGPGQKVVGEVGGRDGPDPVRYGDWEKNGRCIDF
jgi:hypothetical protein